MTALTGRKPGASYTELLKLASGTVSGSLQRIQDGAGNNTPISISSSEISFNNVKLTNLAEPTVASDAATKQYVDNATPTLDADLTAIAALSGTGLARRTGVNTWTLDTNTYLTTNETITLSGDVSGSGTTAISVTLGNVGTAGTYRSVTTDSKGRVTAGTNPTTLSGYGITDAQPLDSDLTAIAGLSTNGLITRTGTGTATTRTITGTAGNITATNGDGVSGNPTLDLATAGTAGTYTKVTTDAYGRVTSGTNISSSDVTTGLGYTPVNRAGDTMTGLLTLSADPSTSLQAATKQYVDTVAAGLDPKNPVRVATTANITLSGLQTIDGVTVIANDRVLVKNQSTATQNGIYLAASGAWTRALDADGAPTGEVSNGNFVLVSEGTTQAGTGWTITSPAGVVTVGTDAVVWTQFHQANETQGANVGSGTGLVFRDKTGTTLNLKSLLQGTGITVTNNANDISIAINSTVATLTGTQTLTNKSLSDSTTFIIDNTDASKRAQFECSSITTGTTRTYTLPNTDGTIALTGNTLSHYGITDAVLKSGDTMTGTLIVDPSITIQNEGGDSALTIHTAGSGGTITSYQYIQTSRGTLTTPTAVQTSDYLSQYLTRGHDGTNWAVGYEMRASVTENWSPSTRGTQVSFTTVKNGASSLSSRMTLQSDGHINVHSNKIINLLDPTNAQDAATKAYADSLVDPANFRKLFKFVATSGQTTFSGLDYNSVTLAYTVGFVDVYLNGAKLDITADFTASTGTSIVLASGATLDDILEIVAYTPATIANSVPLSGGTMTGNLNLPSINSGPLAGFRNVLINGNFDMWQRGVSLSSGTGSRYLADRWRTGSVGTTYTTSRQAFTLGQTSVPYEPEFYHRNVVTSVVGASNHCFLLQFIEDVRTFAGQTITLSFYAKADTTKSMTSEFIQYFGTGGSPSTEVNTLGVNKITLTSSWQKFTNTVTLPSITGKTLGTNADDALMIAFWFDAGSTFNTRTNTLGQQSGTFDIAQVQIELGTQATPFERRHISLEQNMCFRYFERRTASWGNTYPDGTANVDIRARNYSAAANTVSLNIKYKAVKRRVPTVSFQYDINDGASSAGTASVNYTDGFFTDIAGVAASAYVDISDWQSDAEF